MRKLTKRFTGIMTASMLLASLASSCSASSLFGEQQSYSVTMRGNGETVVTARIAITNQSDAPQKQFTFTIPDLKVSQIDGFQQFLTTTCLDPGYPVPLTKGAAILSRPCAQSMTPDYFSTTDFTGSNYTKLVIKNVGNSSYAASLPTAIAPSSSSALILSYRGTGYTSKQLTGAYNFKFQTIKVDDRIDNLTVSIGVDSDQYLDGSTAAVNYATGAAPKSAAATNALVAGASNAQLDSIASQIGQDGSVTKTAKDLAVNDSFSVKGTYADAVWKLHPWRLVLDLLAILIVVSILIWIGRALRKRAPLHLPAQTGSTPSHAPSGSVSAILDPAAIIAGLISAVLLAALIWAFAAYTNQIDTGDVFTTTLTAILVMLAGALIVIVPIVWLSIRRHDWKIAAFVTVWQVLWLIGVLAIYQLGFKANDQAITPGVDNSTQSQPTTPN